ncbi:hypothetical protein JAAARDRAFT_161125 [Jaapia argillacea MUCL 33604]|uniref:Fatty acid desaturase domain-containing protein n=1 Tax=Jaapia argillacea MUCL 33604 TaxID=933084 RepID=A0A067PV06_9AGAM|nr:hypothetical protein JAAARDRAFT_161125 [Jaapia argillacea MUCL 33604]
MGKVLLTQSQRRTSGTYKGRRSDDSDLPEFKPLPWTLQEIRASIPSELFLRDTRTSCLYLLRDLLMASVWWRIACYIDPLCTSSFTRETASLYGAEALRWLCWITYWWVQGLTFTGIWVVGHECGHGAFSSNKWVCDAVGFITHSFLWTPYFSWKISHHRHHISHASIERDEVYVPKTRSDLGIPKAHAEIDYEDYFGDTPIYTLYMLIRQQVLAFPAYLLFNVSGQKKYPKWTNHFDPNSILFNKQQRNLVIISNIGMLAMIWLVRQTIGAFGLASVVKYYGIPWLCVSHWFIMITYLHHTDPDVPHYRKGQWNFQRGAAATVDRDFLGWWGRFFLHDVAHYHVVHHFFPKMPWYNGEKATEHLKNFMGNHYCYSEKPVFRALWDNYNKCQFVEDEGDIVFYRDKHGRSTRRPAQ